MKFLFSILENSRGGVVSDVFKELQMKTFFVTVYVMKTLQKALSGLMILALFAPNLFVFAQELPAVMVSVESVDTSNSTQEIQGQETNENTIVPEVPVVPNESEENVVVEAPGNTDEQVEKEKNTESKEKTLINPSALNAAPNSGGTTIQGPLRPKVSGNTGALEYEYDFKLPAGRNGMVPEIGLTYNSQIENNQNYAGFGFNLSIPYIQRLNTKGVEHLYSREDFTSNVYGDLVKSTSTSTPFFYAKLNDLTRAEFSRVGDTWEVKDNQGLRYIYGGMVDSRIQNPENSSEVYRWYLTDVYDVFNNNTHYTYIEDNGFVYPDSITYTNSPKVTGIYEFKFNWENRLDQLESYQSGFKIKNTLRLSTADLFVNRIQKKKFTFRYSPGTNSVRSLLAGITERGYGENGTMVSLPETAFMYSQPQTENKTLNVAAQIDRIMDINGDGLLDFVFARGFYGIDPYGNRREEKTLYLNKQETTFPALPLINLTTTCAPNPPQPNCVSVIPPTQVPFLLSNNITGTISQTQVFPVDLDGDGYIDVVGPYTNFKGFPTQTITSSSTPTQIITATSSLFFGQDASINFPTNNIGINAIGLNQVNANGDSTPDFMLYAYNSNFLHTLNDQNQFANSTSVLANYFSRSGTSQNDPEFFSYVYMDVNGDTLTDLIQVFSTWYELQPRTETKRVWINTGKALEQITNPIILSQYNLPRSIETLTWFTRASTNFYEDINFDGLPDAITMEGESAIGTGMGFLGLYDYGNSYIPSSQNALAADLNGDGLVDIAQRIGTPSFQIKMSKMKSDLLVNVKNGFGGESVFEYAPAASYKKMDGSQANKIAYPVWTVKSETIKDGLGLDATRSFLYEDAYVSHPNRQDTKLAGFGKVTVIEPDNTKIISYYHQGNENSSDEINDAIVKIGQTYKQETYTPNGSLIKKDLLEYIEAPNPQSASSTASVISKLLSSETSQVTGQTVSTAKSFEYNTNLDKIREVDFGVVTGVSTLGFTDVNSQDTKIVETAYGNSSLVPQRYLPISKTLKNTQALVFGLEKYYYDSLPFGSINFGNNTKVERFNNSTHFVTTIKEYDSYGLVTEERDANGNPTTYRYDTYNLFPQTITNALGHATTYSYDYAIGKPLTATTPNATYSFEYDGFGRALKEIAPDAYGSSALKTQYIYVDTPGAVMVQKTNYLDDQNGVETYQYFDGLNRLAQERKEAETAGTFNVRDIKYNNLGLVQSESLSYVGIGAGKTSPTGDMALYTTNVYDPLQRIASVTNNVGVTTYGYDNWKTIVTDANGKQKNYYKDAYNNLTKVEEINDGATYTTNYTWSLNNKLTNITDALGNVRNFTYDALGQRLTAEDLHSPVDTSFGIWTYAYDPAGNLIQTHNPENQIVEYVYDELNRVKTENYIDETGIEITYDYDTCANGIGKLCTVTQPTTKVTFKYNPSGLVSNENKEIHKSLFSTSFLYDRQGNVVQSIVPDQDTFYRSYNNAGLLEKIQYGQAGMKSMVRNLVENIDYSPVGQVSYQKNNNGTETIKTYDSNKSYRLTRINTKLQAADIQDLNYTYDSNGNIIQVVDASDTAGAKTVTYTYDDLNRMLSATATNVASGQSGYTQTYTYDAIGNITNGPAGAYVYNGTSASNWANPHAATSIAGATLTYDKSGNMLSDEVLTNTWNYKQQLAHVEKDKNTFEYAYDHEGNRLRVMSDAEDTYYPNKFYSVDASDKKTKNVFAGDQLVATIETSTSTNNIFYNHTDHLGSVNVVTDASGAQTQLLDYFPYGSKRIESGTDVGQREFIGQIFDEESGLSYLNARYYDGNRGQFISQDKIAYSFDTDKELYKNYLANPQVHNTYNYGLNNPIKYTDPTGNCVGPLAAVCIAGAAWLGTTEGAATIGALSATAPLWTAQMIEGFDIVSNPNSTLVDKGFAGLGMVPFFGVGKQVSVAKDILKQGDVISGLKVTTHAAEQFAQRNMDLNQITNAIKNGTKYVDTSKNTLVHVVGEKTKGGYTIVTDRAQKVLVTVQNFVQKLSSNRYKLIDKK